jgi:hypothetical protein
MEAGRVDVVVEPLTVLVEDYALANQILALEGITYPTARGGQHVSLSHIHQLGHTRKAWSERIGHPAPNKAFADWAEVLGAT